MGNSILLSIIVPVYNVEKYLDRCINSILSIKPDGYEIILVDDGSTDSSAKICDRLVENNKKVIKVIHKSNGGLSSARNVGLDVASGEYVFFLDSDDSVDNRFFDILDPILSQRNIDLIEIGCYWERELNNINPRIDGRLNYLTTRQCIENIIKNKTGNEICLKLYRRKLFEGLRFPVGRNYEDIATYYKLLLRAKTILSTDSELYIYNITNSNSITKSVSIKNMTDMYNSVNELCEGITNYCVENGIDMDYLEYYKRHSYIYIYLKLQSEELKHTDLKKMIQSYLEKNNSYNLVKYRHYDIKRWLYYEFWHLLKKM